MAFDTLQVKTVKGLLNVRFTNTISPSVNRRINMAWAGKRDWGE